MDVSFLIHTVTIVSVKAKSLATLITIQCNRTIRLQKNICFKAINRCSFVNTGLSVYDIIWGKKRKKKNKKPEQSTRDDII